MMWWVMLASAGPYQMLAPASTLDLEHSEAGAGLGYTAATELPDQGLVSVAGWVRYGLVERVEVSGGAALPLNPVDLGVHGGVRFQPLGPEGTEPGVKGSLGAFVGTQARALALPSVTVPVAVGYRSRVLEVFVQPSGSVYSTTGGPLGAWNVEAGIAVFSTGFPLYLTASYGAVGGVGLMGANVGGGYDMAL